MRLNSQLSGLDLSKSILLTRLQKTFHLLANLILQSIAARWQILHHVVSDQLGHFIVLYSDDSPMLGIRLHCKLKVFVAHVHFHLGGIVLLFNVGELADAERYYEERLSGSRLSESMQLL